MNIINELEYEQFLIQFLFTRQDVRKAVLPHLTGDIFYDFTNKLIIKIILKFIDEFKSFPKFNDIKTKFESDEQLEHFKGILKKPTSEYTDEYLISEVEKFIRRRLINNVIAKYSETIKEQKDEIDTKEIVTANSFFFDTKVGVNVGEDIDLAFDVIQGKDDFVETSMPSFNYFLGGGFFKCGLTIFVGVLKIGKTLIMNSCASNLCEKGKKVLYVTLEMPEAMIYRRAMTNIYNIDFSVLRKMSKPDFKILFDGFKEKIKDKYIIKDYPAGSINTNKIRHLLSELKTKRNFVPDAIFVDYITLMNPNVHEKTANSNTQLQKISEELHGLAKETKTAIITAMQFNREGYKAGDKADAGNVGTGFSPLQTADLVIYIKQTDELKSANKFKFEKGLCRYTNSGEDTHINVDYGKMKIFEDESIRNLSNASQNERNELITSESKSTKDDFMP